jgi:hypothetical protein
VRLTCHPLLVAPGANEMPVLAEDGRRAALWASRQDWQCRDHLLRLLILGPEAIDLPACEASEPAAGAVARLDRAVRGQGGIIALLNPASSFGAERIAFAEGIRLFAIAEPADEACWDAMLSLARPVYGLRGTVACDCRSLHPGALISALAYGNFVCEEGLTLERFDEQRSGVDWRAAGDCEATVIIRGGFEAARVAGREGAWRDRGSEGYVRLVIRGGGGALWTQPRFVAAVTPSAPTGSHGC